MMNLRIIFILGFIWVFQIVFSQKQKFPFGVETPLYWLNAEEESGNLVLKERIHHQVLATQSLSEAKKINYNWAFALHQSEGFTFPFTQQQAEQYSIFVVYEPKNPQHEQNLWFLSKKELSASAPLIVATNHRLADYTGGEFRSYPEKLNSERVKIHYYQHYKNLDTSNEKQDAKSQPPMAKSYQLNFGGKVLTLPPLAFSGYISEVLVYDRVLSNLERQQVASYLAIKYGVSLHQFHYKNYYNPNGEKIWDYEKHQSFNQNITAAGQHHEGNLSQLKSLNSNDEQVAAMQISAKNGAEIPNDYYVFWSDNGQGLKIEKQKEGQPESISRVWALDYQSNNQIQLDWGIDLRKIESSKESQDTRYKTFDAKNSQLFANSQKPSADYYWLVWDDSGEGTFAPQSTQYFRLRKTSDPQVSEIKDWQRNVSPTSHGHYSIWQAPEMFAHLGLKQGKCHPNQLAELQFKMVGGEAPYQIQVRSLDQNLVPQTWTELQKQGQKQLQLPSGRYVYEVKDRYNHSYIQELYLTDEDAPQPQLNAEYLLGKESIVLDASQGLPKGHYTYEWYRDGQLLSQNPSYLLNQAGSYELRVKNEAGCHSVAYFKALEQTPQMSDTQVVLYPNPSRDGHFKVMASFPKTTSGMLSIYDTSGRLLSTQEFYNLSQYEYNGHMTASGVYILQLKTTLGMSSHKLIVGTK